ncbi:MAG TPA: serine hydrolase domain-containing protein [Devosia sp.]
MFRTNVIAFASSLALALSSLSGGTQAKGSADVAAFRDLIATLARQHDFSGVAYVRIDGIEFLRTAWGDANRELGVPMTTSKIFAIGSRSMDFTIAGILMLVERGKLTLTTTLAEVFDAVPEDKAGISVEQLLRGQSGLHDFPALASDWDPDLAWIDRAELERRALAQELLFEPGSDHASSHTAYGLLAAIIERISGQDYFEFLKANIFDPAGMRTTAEYGTATDQRVPDFAAGGGPARMGVPNIPPNWGRVSWLVRGSGGMYSTLDDLLRFYHFVRSGRALSEPYGQVFRDDNVSLDGSDRGFEIFSASDEGGSDQVLVMVNVPGGGEALRLLAKAGEEMVARN